MVLFFFMYRKYGLKNTPCIFCTSTIPGGRMTQGAMDGGVTVHCMIYRVQFNYGALSHVYQKLVFRALAIFS